MGVCGIAQWGIDPDARGQLESVSDIRFELFSAELWKSCSLQKCVSLNIFSAPPSLSRVHSRYETCDSEDQIL